MTLVAVLLASAASAQSSGIAGAVRDGSAAVMPGVTVEATSPALIEKVRTVITDGEGRYILADLRPGTYSVTFTLPGFKTVKREGVVLTAGFTATVNVELEVGALEETITVTGATPLVDTQNVQQQKVVSNELLASLPSGSRALSNLITLTPGMTGTADVGGSSGLYRSNAPRVNAYHGKAGVKVVYDGMNTLAPIGVGALAYMVNPATAEETTVDTGGATAESSGSGILMNMIPKTGSNQFSFTASSLFADNSMQSDNLTDALRGRGVTHTNEVLRLYDLNVTAGGPIVSDRVWFFGAARAAGNKNTVAGVFFNKTQGTLLYTPDVDRPAYRHEWFRSGGGRLTWQASRKDKISGFVDVQTFFNRGRGEFISPEAFLSAYNLSPQSLIQLTWNSVRSNELLLEGGLSLMDGRWPYPSPGDGFMRVNPDDISVLELSTGFRYNAKASYSDITDQSRYVQRFSASYVTGSHLLKAGIQVEEGISDIHTEVHRDVNYIFLNGIPNTITQFATPNRQENRIRADLGLFVSDRWTVNRLTLNYGLRFDSFNGYVPAQQVPAGRFTQAREFGPVRQVPAWRDLNPRLGASYDLFGNGRTALKVSLSRFVEAMGTAIASDNNPIVTSVLSANRTWNDVNRNYVPDCNLTDFAGNGECGPINNTNFGRNNPNASRYDPSLLKGFAVRNFAWDFATEMQHELRPGLSVTAGYYRNWAGNHRVSDNLAVTPQDFSPFCVTAPSDARLPGGGGYQVCGLYDLAPARFGQVSNLVAPASRYYEEGTGVTCGFSGSLAGVASRGNGVGCGTSDFVNVSVNARLSGAVLGGGVDTGRTVIDRCFVVDSPGELLHCRVVTPFKAQTQVKLFGTYSLPGDFEVSGTFQNVSGAPFEANYNASNVEIARSLGRDLAACGVRTGAGCTATVTVPLVAPMTTFLERRTQLDLRLTKVVRLRGNMRLQANIDFYNVLNGSAVLGVNSTYGPTWQRPATENTGGGVDTILPGRLIQVGGQFSF
jgi:hypothetical protein